MNALNINNFKFVKNKDNYIYTCEIKNGIYFFKRILKNEEIVIIKVLNNIVEFNYIKNKEIINNLSLLEKDKIVNDILNTLNCKTLINFIDFNKILNAIKESYINIICSNDLIGLSVNKNLIDVILLETNSIIGSIKIDFDVKINVDKVYFKETLNVLNKYLNSIKYKRLIRN